MLKHLGINRECPVFDWLRQTVDPEEDVLERFGVDTRYVHIGKPKSWMFASKQTERGLYVVDEWGCGFVKTPTTLYYNLIDSPLSKAKISDLDSYAWPDPRDPGYLDGVAERAGQIETGKVDPSLSTLRKIAIALDVPLFSFMLTDDARPTRIIRGNERRQVVFPKAGLNYDVIHSDLNKKMAIMIGTLSTPPKF